MSGLYVRRRDALFRRLIPAGPRHPGYDAVGGDGWRVLNEAAPPITRWGLRGSVVLLTVACALRRDPDAYLATAEHHGSYLMRQAIVLIKTVGCMLALDETPLP